MLSEPEMNITETPNRLLDTIWQNLQNNDIRRAIATSNQLVQKFPDHAPGWHAASHVAQQIRQPKQALLAIDKALKLEPNNTDWQLHRVGCLLMSGDNAAGKKAVSLLISQSATFKNSQLSNLAFLCNRLELHADAYSLYRKLTSLEPKHGAHWYNLATIQRFQGDLEGAEASLNSAIRLNPDDYEAWELRSDLRKQTPESNHIDELKGLLKNGTKTPSGEVRICFAMAKELEDIGDFSASFETLSRGASLRRKHINYSIDGDMQTIEAIIRTFDQDRLTPPVHASTNNEPVFIIGLPRTGTTLVERILGSHSSVFAAGELNNFALQLMQLIRQQSTDQKLTRRALVEKSAEIDFGLLGESYLESTRPRTGHSEHFVDKMPLNFLYAGLIHKALPNAKIVHLVRNPVDTCYAVYKRLFQDGYPWSYDLEEIADYYLAYRRLMTHWDAVMPGLIHQVSYEDLVRDTESEARRLLEFCGLTFEQQCLEFNQNMATTTTASAVQVRRGIYTTSIDRWRDYERHLEPVITRLRKAGIQIDQS